MVLPLKLQSALLEPSWIRLVTGSSNQSGSGSCYLHVDMLRVPVGPEPPEELQDSCSGLERIHLKLEVEQLLSLHDQPNLRLRLSGRFHPRVPSLIRGQ